MRKLFFAAALSFVAALPASAQFARIGSPIDPGGSWVGPVGPAVSGGTPAFAQTFMRPAAGFNWLQSFTFYLGDNSFDFSGPNLFFRGAVYEVSGGVLGNQLFLSSVQAGSPNNSGFDTYFFSTTNLFLDPGVNTFALVLQSVSNVGDALNVIAAGATDYTDGEFYVVNGDNSLSPAIDGTSDAAFDATLSASAVPEPATFVLFASGLLLVGGVARTRSRRHGNAELNTNS